ncbi:hypothetical protein H6504_00190 [Candidatus Woesearchaeota archaeon]|nr:hypothetical protein [Candidatus Woesearchaeota archaeon]
MSETLARFQAGIFHLHQASIRVVADFVDIDAFSYMVREAYDPNAYDHIATEKFTLPLNGTDVQPAIDRAMHDAGLHGAELVLLSGRKKWGMFICKAAYFRPCGQ